MYRIQGNCFHKRVLFAPDIAKGQKGIRIYSKSLALFLKCFGKRIETYKTNNGKILYLDRNSFLKWVRRFGAHFHPSTLPQDQIQFLSANFNPQAPIRAVFVPKRIHNITKSLKELCEAIKNSNVNKAKDLLERFQYYQIPLPLDSIRIGKLSLLAYATSKGSLELVKLLVEHGASINIDTEGEKTFENSPLFQAFESKSDQKHSVIEFLLKNNAVVIFDWLPSKLTKDEDTPQFMLWFSFILSIKHADDKTLSLIIHHFLSQGRKKDLVYLLDRTLRVMSTLGGPGIIPGFVHFILVLMAHGIYPNQRKLDSRAEHLERLIPVREQLSKEKILSYLIQAHTIFPNDLLPLILDYTGNCEDSLTREDNEAIAQDLIEAMRIRDELQEVITQETFPDEDNYTGRECAEVSDEILENDEERREQMEEVIRRESYVIKTKKPKITLPAKVWDTIFDYLRE